MAAGNTQRHYDDEEQKTALRMAAAVGVAKAAEHLNVNRKTIYRWREVHAEYWSGLVAGDIDEQQRAFATRLDSLAEQYVDAEVEALGRAEKLIATADAKETAALIKAMGSSRGLATQNARAARGQHDEVDVNINFPAIEQALEKILGTADPPPALPTPNLAEVSDVIEA